MPGASPLREPFSGEVPANPANWPFAGSRRFDIADGAVQTIRSVINPDKLRHLGPVADVYALLRQRRGQHAR
jgi:hypothetical protein